MILLVIYLFLLATASLAAGAAIAGSLGGPRLRITAGPALALVLPGMLLLFFTALRIPHAHWLVLLALALAGFRLRYHLLGGAPVPPPPVRSSGPLEKAAGFSIFFVLAVAFLQVIQAPPAFNMELAQLETSARMIATGEITPEIPPAPAEAVPAKLVAPLQAAMGGALAPEGTRFDERALPFLGLLALIISIWMLRCEMRRNPTDGSILILAGMALLPGWLGAGGITGGTGAPVLGMLYLALFLSMRSSVRGKGGRTRPLILALMLSLPLPWLGPQGWVFLLAASLWASVKGAARRAPLWAGPALLCTPLLPVLAAALWKRSLAAGVLLPIRTGEEFWHGPAGYDAFVQIVFAPHGASTLALVLLLGALAALFLPRKKTTPAKSSGLGIAVSYLLLAGLLPGLIETPEQAGQRLLEIAPLAALALQHLLATSQALLSRPNFIQRRLAAPLGME